MKCLTDLNAPFTVLHTLKIFQKAMLSLRLDLMVPNNITDLSYDNDFQLYHVIFAME